jgi:hypothetical protein
LGQAAENENQHDDSKGCGRVSAPHEGAIMAKAGPDAPPGKP